MANKRKQFTPEFKQSAIDFVNAHPEMTVLQCANHLEIGLSTLQRWKREAKENPGQPVPFVGSGNYSSEIEKENIRLQKELRDTQVDMFTTVFIGNSHTRNIHGKMVTPRGYRLETEKERA